MLFHSLPFNHSQPVGLAVFFRNKSSDELLDIFCRRLWKVFRYFRWKVFFFSKRSNFHYGLMMLCFHSPDSFSHLILRAVGCGRVLKYLSFESKCTVAIINARWQRTEVSHLHFRSLCEMWIEFSIEFVNLSIFPSLFSLYEFLFISYSKSFW